MGTNLIAFIAMKMVIMATGMSINQVGHFRELCRMYWVMMDFQD